MLQALKICIDLNNVIVKKSSMGSISIVFRKRNPIVISDDSECNLSSMGCTKEDLLSSNIEWLVRKGVLSLIVE
jgi:hypothetical protein